MIFDTRTINELNQLNSCYNELRKVRIGIESDHNTHIRFYEPKNIRVLSYYTQPLILFDRIVNILGYKKGELRSDNQKGKSRTLVWSIMSSFGHSNSAIARVFGLSPKTAGLTQYYRDKLKQQMRTDPSIVMLYEKTMRILERDIESLDEEMTENE